MNDLAPTERQAARTQTHGPDGKFIRTVEQAELDAKAARMRSRSMSYRAIAAALGVTVGAAHSMVERALAAIPKEAGEMVRVNELAKLDAMEDAVLAVLEARHYTVSNGKLIYLGDDPLLDDAPVLAAVDRLVRVQERRARLLGLDAPAKMETAATVRYTYEGVDTEGV